MTPEQQRIVIAECLGWKNIHGSARFESVVGVHPKSGFTCDVPDYPNDLNACRVMESTLTRDQTCKYVDILYNTLKCQPGFITIFMVVNATSEQRCEAFLRTKSLWKE